MAELYDIWCLKPISCVDGPYRNKQEAINRVEELTKQTKRTHMHILQGSTAEKQIKKAQERGHW